MNGVKNKWKKKITTSAIYAVTVEKNKMKNPKQNLAMASLWFTMYDINHKVFDGKLYLLVKDIVGKEIEIQISNAEVNERARLQNELTIEKYLINITDKERDIVSYHKLNTTTNI